MATEEKAVQAYKDFRTTVKIGGFNSLQGISNDDLVTGSIPEGDMSEAKSKTFEAEPYTSSVSGINWKVDDDTLEVCCGADKEVPK